MVKKWAILIEHGIVLILITTLIFFIFTGSLMDLETKSCLQEKTELTNQLTLLEEQINELKENKEYSKTELTKIKNDKQLLQTTYNSLNTDFFNCFMANYCLYSPDLCLEYVEVDLDPLDVHYYYSDECDSSLRDWDKYMSFDTDIN